MDYCVDSGAEMVWPWPRRLKKGTRLNPAAKKLPLESHKENKACPGYGDAPYGTKPRRKSTIIRQFLEKIRSSGNSHLPGGKGKGVPSQAYANATPPPR